MKKSIITIIFFLCMGLLTSSAFCAPYLACDVQSDITSSEVEITVGGSPQVVAGLTQLSADTTAILLLDLAAYTPGDYTFRARWAGANGWWSDWSDTFDATKPSMPAGLKILAE